MAPTLAQSKTDRLPPKQRGRTRYESIRAAAAPVLSRLLQAIATLWVVVTVVFLLSRLNGNPAYLLAPPDATPEQISQISQALGLNDPIYVQYFRYLHNVSTGDFGQSFIFGVPVSSLIITALPYSLWLGLAAFLYASVIGIGLGSIAALRPGSSTDGAVQAIVILGQSIPSYWLGVLLVLLFAVEMHVMPPFGSDSATGIILPAITLGSLPLAATARLTRSAMLEVLRSDFVLFERSKGVDGTVLFLHILRNASLPVITLTGLQLGFLISGAVVVETLFAWPGLGRLAVQAINSRDYNVIQGVVLTYTFIFVALNLIIDVSYGWLDPRIRGVGRAR